MIHLKKQDIFAYDAYLSHFDQQNVQQLSLGYKYLNSLYLLPIFRPVFCLPFLTTLLLCDFVDFVEFVERSIIWNDRFIVHKFVSNFILHMLLSNVLRTVSYETYIPTWSRCYFKCAWTRRGLTYIASASWWSRYHSMLTSTHWRFHCLYQYKVMKLNYWYENRFKSCENAKKF